MNCGERNRGSRFWSRWGKTWQIRDSKWLRNVKLVSLQASDYSVSMDIEILPCCQVTNVISIRDQNMIILVFLGKFLSLIICSPASELRQSGQTDLLCLCHTCVCITAVSLPVLITESTYPSLHWLPWLAVLSCTVISHSLWPHGLQPARLLCA